MKKTTKNDETKDQTSEETLTDRCLSKANKTVESCYSRGHIPLNPATMIMLKRIISDSLAKETPALEIDSIC